MVFGTAAGQQLASAPAPSSAPNQTMVFGTQPPAQTPAPAPAVNQTMVFGTPAGQQLASSPGAPAAAANPNATLVFGSAPVIPPTANPNSTMMFGTPAGQAQANAPSPAPAAAPVNQTLVFGNQPPVAPAQPKSTQMFGAPPANAASAKPVSSTMMFGKPPEVAAPNPSKTMAFGAPVAAKKPPVVTASTPEPAEGEGAPRSESTVRVDLERMMREREEPSSEQTEEPAEPARQDRTQLFAMTNTEKQQQQTPSEGTDSVQDRHNRTALFAMSTLQETTKPDGKAPASTAPDLVGVSEPTIGMDSTLPPDNATLPAKLRSDQFGFGANTPTSGTQLEGRGTDLNTTLRLNGPVSSTLPNLPPVADGVHSPLTLELDPSLPVVGSGTVEGAGGDEIEAFAAQGRRRNVIAIVVVLVIVLLAALGVAWQLFGKQLLSAKVDPKWREAVATSLEKLRKDDHDVRVAEIDRLEKLTKEAPEFADGHAALAIALALELDDTQAENDAIAIKYDRLKELAKGDAATNDLRKRINTLVDDSGPLHAALTPLRTRLDGAVTLMRALDASPATARAEAVAKAVTGATAVGGDGTDPWYDLLAATHVLAPLHKLELATAAKADVEKALGELEKAAADNADLNGRARTHLLLARMHHVLDKDDVAKKDVERALELAPKFKAAQGLKTLLER